MFAYFAYFALKSFVLLIQLSAFRFQVLIYGFKFPFFCTDSAFRSQVSGFDLQFQLSSLRF